MAEEIKRMLDNIGKDVYYVCGRRVESCKIHGVTITSSDNNYVYFDGWSSEGHLYEADEGKDWFWTREEAEAHLLSKQTDTFTDDLLTFYDSELLENAIIPEHITAIKKRENGGVIEWRKFEPLRKETHNG